MEIGAGDIDGGHFGIGYSDAFWIAVVVQLAPDSQNGAGGCRRNKFDDDFIADQRFSAPVLADERESCRGTSPIQAAKSRPDRNEFGSGMPILSRKSCKNDLVDQPCRYVEHAFQKRKQARQGIEASV